MQKWVLSSFILFSSLTSFQNTLALRDTNSVFFQQSPQTPESIVSEILEKNQVPEKLSALILSQAILESGHFTSNVFFQANNPFGMRPAKVRKQVACGQYNGYAAYESVAHAVEDYVLWMQAVCIPLHIDTPEAFVRFLLSKGYFEADETDYLRQLRQLILYTKNKEIIA